MLQGLKSRGAKNTAESILTPTMRENDSSAGAVGERIKLLRDSLGLSQTEFAAGAGLVRAAVATWERGAQRPGIALAQKITDRYGVTLDWLFLGRTHTLRHDMIGLLSDKEAAQD